jgi:small subunit ribosomal protein S20
MKKFFEITKKKEAEKELPSLTSMIDKLAKNNIIHDNKAANLKANIAKHAGGLKK